ncbi:YciI family protein [Pyxidicoccus parkwayensis]|uniref:YciI family protein n=1 Tax=Pyxidicoccus parkwayensis TaxID=2813578 RepID=A0ABX7P0S8_9BACT|nr:YciI family protein [Pyxidicoccus parkwaysis]QSQ24219.1 YciI family protein [Pyxidicoccus parkwaysis]
MRFMVIMYPGPAAETGVLPDEKLLAEMGKFNEEMVKAGVLLAGEGLHPTSKGARIRFPKGGKPVVSDGPFAEAKEIVGGFWMIQVKNREEAIEWMRRCPASGGEMIELRQVFESEEFAPSDPTGELRAQEQRLREQVAAKK